MRRAAAWKSACSLDSDCSGYAWATERPRTTSSATGAEGLASEARPNLRSRSELAITETLDRDIAALANTGESDHPVSGYSTPAASGIPIRLYTKAQNRFW